MLPLSALSVPPAGYDLASHRLPPLAIGPALADWNHRRAELDGLWRAYLGHGPQQVPLDAEVVSTETVEGLQRSRVRYQVEDGCRVDAYLLVPPGDGPFPAVVVYHPTTPATLREPVGLAGSPERWFALNLARRGWVTLSPCNYLWDYRGHPGPKPGLAAFKRLVRGELLARYPSWTGMGKMVWDGLRAVDFLVSQPSVDPARLGCVGHSLGGKQVLYSMALDPRLQAGVACEGGLGLPFTNWDAPWYLGEAIRARRDLEHHQLLALAAPRALLILGGGLKPRAADAVDGAADSIQDWSYLEAARPAFALQGAAERLGLYLHNHGHAVPPQAEAYMYAWLAAFLQ